MPNTPDGLSDDEFEMESSASANRDSIKEIDDEIFERMSAKSGRSAGLLAGLAFLLALGAVGIAALNWWTERGEPTVDPDQVETLTRQQASLREELAGLSTQAQESGAGPSVEQVEALQASLQAKTREIGELRGDLELQNSHMRTLQSALEATQARLLAAESSLAARAPQRLDARGQLDLAEVDYLLRLANERLKLFGDVRSAEQALALADAHLAALDNPMYAGIRQHIVEARNSLESVALPDQLEISATIDTLQGKISGLEFAFESGAASTSSQSGEAESGWWQRLKRSLGSLVTVRRTMDGEDRLTIEDKELLRQGLWMQLEGARLAMMRSDQVSWEASLNRTIADLERWFDPQGAEFEAVNETLQSLAQTAISPQLPDISGPWSQLQMIRSVSQSVPASVEQPEHEAPQDTRGVASDETPVETDGGDRNEGSTDSEAEGREEGQSEEGEPAEPSIDSEAASGEEAA